MAGPGENPGDPVPGFSPESEPARRLSALRSAVECDEVSPRDASLWAGLAGLKALPEKKIDAPVAYGVSARQAFTVETQVGGALRRIGPGVQGAGPVVDVAGPSDAAPGGKPSGTADALALLEGELALSDHRYRDDGQRAVQALRARLDDAPLPRAKEVAGPVDGRRRVRQHRYRAHLSARRELLHADPAHSVGQPYLVLPSQLTPGDLPHVPARQLRRGNPPELAWLAGQVAELERSYRERDGAAARLARITAWAFARYGASPDPLLEARALKVAAAVAREEGGMAAYWLAERVRYLVGDRHIYALGASHDSIIVLRNNGYWAASRSVMARSLSFLRHGEDGDGSMDDPDAWISYRRLLGQLTTHYFTGPQQVIGADDARAYLRVDVEESGIGYDAYWYPAMQRNLFEIEMVVARRRSLATGERFWLPDASRRLLDLADGAMSRCVSPMWQAQWALLRMRLGLFRRDPAEVQDAANAYFVAGTTAPYVIRDHASERHEYRRNRQAAARVDKVLARVLPELPPERELADP